MSFPPKLWDGVVRRLGEEIPVFALEAWVRPLVPEIREDELCLACPTLFHRDRVSERYLTAIERCVENEVGERVRVTLVHGSHGRSPAPRCIAARPQTSRPDTASASASASTSNSAPESTPVSSRKSTPVAVPDPDRARPGPAKVNAPQRAEPATRATPAAHKNQRVFPYSFDDFVVGPCNALARAASVAVAEDRQRGLNPLYLASGIGLGKTHLAQSIVDEARRRSDTRVLYGSAEDFTNRFMSSIRSRDMENFKRRFRGCNLLVVEDVQFLDSKAGTQLELFHTISHLLDVGARVVLSADRLPRDIKGLDPRLSSQMAAGLVAEIERPDFVVRRQILASKASRGGVKLPDECLDLLAHSVRGSVRDLEGVLIQLVASASLMDRPVDMDLTREALHKLVPGSIPGRRLELQLVIETVASFFQTTPAALAARSRRRDVLIPRQLAMYFCHRLTDAPLSAIARALGREHPAVSNAIKIIERRILEQAPLRYQVEALSTRLSKLQQPGPGR